MRLQSPKKSRALGICAVLCFVHNLAGSGATVSAFSPSLWRQATSAPNIPEHGKGRMYRIRSASPRLESTSSPTPPIFGGHDTTPSAPPVYEQSKDPAKLAVVAWIHLINVFVIVNYLRPTIWPSFLSGVPLQAWALMHVVAAMLFSGSIITTAVLEFTLSSLNGDLEDHESLQKVLGWLWKIESKIVFPSLALSLVSGIGQSFALYSTFHHAPFHVKSALHMIFLFGLWWQWTDFRSQVHLKKNFDTEVFNARQFSNAVSCVFVFALYAIMVLKPSP